MTHAAETIAKLERNLANLPSKDQGFAKSLVDYFKKNRKLSQNQMPWAEKFASYTPPVQTTTQVTSTQATGMLRIHELFDRARDNNIKEPILRMRADEVDIKIRPKGSDLMFYAGSYPDSYKVAKLSASGELTLWNEDRVPALLGAMKHLAEAPLESMKAYGRRTGTCCMCGRELTNKESIEAGIGPICAGNWGV